MFGEPISDDLMVINYLSPFEALLLDFVLASAEAEAWLRYPEADALFGEKAAQARRDLDAASLLARPAGKLKELAARLA